MENKVTRWLGNEKTGVMFPYTEKLATNKDMVEVIKTDGENRDVKKMGNKKTSEKSKG